MSNIQIETDLKEILQELKDGQKAILEKTNSIDKRLIKVETKLESVEKSIDKIEGSQKTQIWSLIGILIAAVGGLLQ